MPLCSQYLQYEWAKPQTTGSSVKFYQPWILIVYSRIMLGNVRSCIFFSLGFVSFTPLLFCQRNSQNQRTHTTQTIHEMFLFFLWWSSWFHLMSEPLRVPHIWLRLLWNTSFTHPHPTHVNLLKCFTEIMTCLKFFANLIVAFYSCRRSNDNVFTGKCFIMSICFGVYMHSDDSVSFSPTRGSNRTHLDK